MDPTSIPVFALFLVFVVAAILWHYGRSADILRKWADDNGYEILEKHFRHFFRGPFFFTTTKNQTVYRVRVRDKAGHERTGWVACGGWWLGIWTNRAKVRWDEIPQVSESPMRDRWLDG